MISNSLYSSISPRAWLLVFRFFFLGSGRDSVIERPRRSTYLRVSQVFCPVDAVSGTRDLRIAEVNFGGKQRSGDAKTLHFSRPGQRRFREFQNKWCSARNENRRAKARRMISEKKRSGRSATGDRFSFLQPCHIPGGGLARFSPLSAAMSLPRPPSGAPL